MLCRLGQEEVTKLHWCVQQRILNILLPNLKFSSSLPRWGFRWHLKLKFQAFYQKFSSYFQKQSRKIQTWGSFFFLQTQCTVATIQRSIHHNGQICRSHPHQSCFWVHFQNTSCISSKLESYTWNLFTVFTFHHWREWWWSHLSNVFDNEKAYANSPLTCLFRLSNQFHQLSWSLSLSFVLTSKFLVIKLNLYLSLYFCFIRQSL